jgi:hypothetical protein
MSNSPSSGASGDSSGSNNGGDILNYTALIVALVALVISILQLILQYVLSAQGRSKVGTAAIGLWANKNKYYWRPWRAKIYIKVSLYGAGGTYIDYFQYTRPSISIQQFLNAIQTQGEERQASLDVLRRYKVTERMPSECNLLRSPHHTD